MLSEAEHTRVLALFCKEKGSSTLAPHFNTLLVLRGLLACGVLQLGLTKRWRVNYGENPKAREISIRMAVPYRAKDVASEKTEFGHPDVAFILTQLSYYYSGLESDQLMECFRYLKQESQAEQEYNSWIGLMDSSHVHPSISALSGVNLEDYEQVRMLKTLLDLLVYPESLEQQCFSLVMLNL
jgi:hypothetical protein